MKSKRILVVDDDNSARSLLVTWLQHLFPQDEIFEATDGAKALALLSTRSEGEQPVDLLLTDYHMPMMDGFDLARNVRQRWPGLPIVMITGSPNSSQVHSQVRALKLEGLLEKPFDMAALEKLISQSDQSS